MGPQMRSSNTRTRLSARPWVRSVRGLASGERAREPMMLALGMAVGLGTGLLAVVLIEAIGLVQSLAWGSSPARWMVLVVPTAGGLVVGLLTTTIVPEARGAGVGEVMRSIALHGGRMRPHVALGKLGTTAVSIGTGASGGREGPIVQIGGGVGSSLGRLFALDEDQKRALIAAGAGAGIAASFNAPIGGMLFALEVILGGFKARYLQVLVVASVVASVTAREIVGPGLIYTPPPYRLEAPVELAFYLLIGVLAALVAVAFIRGELAFTDLVERIRLWPPALTALGGLFVGVLALGLPEVLGTGDHLPPVAGVETDPIASMLAGQLGGTGLGAVGLLLLLLAAKLVATVVAIGTGSSVGSFAPSIFLGAALGNAVGHLALLLMPGAPIRPGALALAGMAGVLGASSRAPLTAILITFELTGDYGMVLPLMFSVGIAMVLADRLAQGSLYTLPLLRSGIVYAEPEDIDIMQSVRVSEIMTRAPDTVPALMPLPALHREFRRSGHHGYPVVDHGDRLVGVVTASDLARALGRPAGEALQEPDDDDTRTAGDICTRRPMTVTPSDPVFRALRRMASLDVGRLPVVDEQDHGRLVGLVRRSDLVKAYQRAVSRSLGSQQRQATSRLRDLVGADFMELVVDSRAPVAGLAVRDVDWPPRTVLTSVRRSGELIMPNGSTVLAPGDEVVVLADRAHTHQLEHLLTGRGGPR
jgi:chloride channel protein, CIC family